MNTRKNLLISMGCWVIFGTWGVLFAQDVPTLNPPDASWPTPPIGGAPPPPVPGSDGVPPPGAVPPPTGTFEPFDFGGDDSGGFGGGFGGGSTGGSSTREGKNSFQMLSPGGDRSQCSRFGNDALGDRTYDDYGSCSNDLEKKIDRIRGDLDEVFDRFERQKLKTVIRGNLSRKQAEAYKLEFPKLRQSILVAAKKGCVCRP